MQQDRGLRTYGKEFAEATTLTKIEVLPYNADWPHAYEKESQLLKEALGSLIVKIHHIGSTSVKNLAAKPVIDILIETTSLADLDKCSNQFDALAYEVKGEFGIAGRRYYQKGGANRTHQIHAFKVDDDNIHRHIVFRDYLAAHPEIMKKYQMLKMKMAQECNNDIEIYCDGKDAFIKHYEAKALQWAQAPP